MANIPIIKVVDLRTGKDLFLREFGVAHAEGSHLVFGWEDSAHSYPDDAKDENFEVTLSIDREPERKKAIALPLVILGLLAAIIILSILLFRRPKPVILNSPQISKVQVMQTVRNLKGEMVGTQEVVKMQAGYQSQIDDLSKEVFQLRDKRVKTNSIERVHLIVRVDTLFIPFLGDDTAVAAEVATRDESNSILVPKEFFYSDTIKTISGKITKEGIMVDSLYLPNTLSIRQVTQKYGFLHMRKRSMVQAHNSNALFKTTAMSNLQIIHRPSRWNRWIKPLVFSVATGIVVHQAGK